MKRIDKFFSVFIISILFLSYFSLTISHVLRLELAQIDTWDFGVYQKAFVEISSLNELNPYVPIRNSLIFNDHFDPIVAVVSLLSYPFMEYSSSLLLIEFFFLMLGAFVLYRLVGKEWGVFSVIILLLSRGLYPAMSYPVHPTTWAVLPIVLTIYNYEKEKLLGFVFSILFLFLFKEIFPIAILCMGVGELLFNRRKEFSFWMIVLSLVFIFFIFYLRPIYWGNIQNYADFKQQGLSIHLFNWGDLIKVLLPCLPLIYLFIKKNLFERKTIVFLFFYFSILGMHILKGRSYYHYGVLFMAPLASYLFIRLKTNVELFSRRFFWFTVIIAILISFNSISKSFKSFSSTLNTYKKEKKYLDTLKELDDFIVENKIIFKNTFSIAGMSTRFQKAGFNFFEINNYQKKQKEYDYFLLSENVNTLVYPHSKENLNSMKACALSNGGIMLFNKNEISLIKGPISGDCFEKFKN